VVYLSKSKNRCKTMDTGSMSMDGETAESADSASESESEVESTEVDEAKVNKYHKNGKCPHAFFRRKFSGAWQGTDAEYNQVMTEGGVGITEPMTLFLNLAGSQKLVIEPMQEGEQLYVVDPGGCQTDHTLIERCAKLLALDPKHGKRDISTKYWLDDQGSALPIYTNGVKGGAFSDNITCYAKDKSNLIDFFKHANIRTGHKDPEYAASFCPCIEKKDKKGRGKWKISLAGLPLVGIEFIHYVMAESIAWHSGPEGLNFNKLQEFISRNLHFFNGPSAFFQSNNVSDLKSRLVAMMTEAAKIGWCDTDLTIDFAGTLHGDRMKENVMKSARGYAVENHSCGHNMVRLKPIQTQLADGTIMWAHVKAYNKWAETLEQGAARNQEIACKFPYAICPSTQRLKDKFWDSDYYQNGITRFEVTFTSVPDPLSEDRLIVSVRDMNYFLEQHLYLLDCALVTRSFDDHLRHMESLVERTLVLYIPDLYVKKRKEYITKKHPNNRRYNSNVRKSINKNSDAIAVRWVNATTGKANGVTVKTDFTSKQSSSDNASRQVAEVLAWCSTCGSNPYLMVGVRGFAEKDSQPGLNTPKPIHKLYLRRVEIQRTVAGAPIDVQRPQPEVLTYFPGKTLHGGKQAPVRCIHTDFSKIGVDVSTHANIRPAVFDMSIQPNYYTMGQLDIRVVPFTTVMESSTLTGSLSASPYNVGEETATTSSECRRRTAGIPETTRKVKSLTDVPQLVSKWGYKNPQGRPRSCVVSPKTLCIWLGAVHKDKYEVPVGHSRQLGAELEKDPHADTWVWCDPKVGFRWEMRPKGGDWQVVLDNAKVVAISNLPAIPTHQTIRNAEFGAGKNTSEMLSVTMDTGKKFYLPKSIREWFVAQYNRNNVVSNIRGMRIHHPLRRTVRVSGYSNQEEAIAIIATGHDTVLHSNYSESTDETPSVKKRRLT
jgi:hypothetical protein